MGANLVRNNILKKSFLMNSNILDFLNEMILQCTFTIKLTANSPCDIKSNYQTTKCNGRVNNTKPILGKRD